MKIEWSFRARLNYFTLLDYMESEFGEVVLWRWVDDVESAIELIRTNPQLYPFARPRSRARRAVVHEFLTIYYREKKDSVELISLWDNRRNPRKIKL